MKLTIPSRGTFGAGACALALALGVAACGSTVSTSSFKGEEHAVAQTVANLQADTTTGEEKKICTEDLAAPVVKRLGGVAACESAVKSQLTEIDSLELSVSSIKLDAAAGTATAEVRSIVDGKTRPGTLTLVKEDGKWRISGE